MVTQILSRIKVDIMGRVSNLVIRANQMFLPFLISYLDNFNSLNMHRQGYVELFKKLEL